MEENLHNNSENQLRRTLMSDDFSTDSWDNPSGNVWEGIEATLPQASPKRVWIWRFLLPAAFLLSGVTGYWYFSTVDSIDKPQEQMPVIALDETSGTSAFRGASAEEETNHSENQNTSTEHSIQVKEPTNPVTKKENSRNALNSSSSINNKKETFHPNHLQHTGSTTVPQHKTSHGEVQHSTNYQQQLSSQQPASSIPTPFEGTIIRNPVPSNTDNGNLNTVAHIPSSSIQPSQTIKKTTEPITTNNDQASIQTPIKKIVAQSTVGPLASKQTTAIPLTKNELFSEGPVVGQLIDPVLPIRRTGTWYLGLRYGPSAKGFLLSGKDKENIHKQQRMRYSGTSQILVGHRFNKRLQLEGGVGYSVSNYKFNKKNKFLYDKSKERPDNNHFESDYNINVETGNGNIDVSALLSRHQQDLIADGQEFYLVTDVKERLSVLQIPLHLRYNLMTGKLKWYAKAGLTANWLSGYSGKAIVDVYDSEGLTVKKSTLQQQPGLSQWKALPVDINLASGVEYQLTDRLSLLVEPGLSTGLNAGYKTKDLKSIPVSGNLNVGLNYFF